LITALFNFFVADQGISPMHIIITLGWVFLEYRV
jgi:hypothetical protein